MGRRSDFDNYLPSRRTLLASAAGVTLAGLVSGCTTATTPATPTTADRAGAGGAGLPVRQLSPEPRNGFSESEGARVMQIVAHPDDDLFFMNPDVIHTLSNGVPVISVYVTDGGSFGENLIPGRPKPPADVPAYVSSRQQGLRQAYARMLGAPLFTSWERRTIPLPDGREAEINVLENQGRRAELIFLNIRMHAKHHGKPVNMAHLWGTPGVRLPTQPTPGSPVERSFSYGRDELVGALVSLLRRYRPTLIRTLDPDPDAQVHDKRHPRGSDQVGYSDHPDHTATGLFAWRALAEWADGTARGKVPAFHTESYRGYYNQRWPHNLPAETVALKARYLNAYGGDPSWQCGNSAGCGDYDIGSDRVLISKKGWVRSTHRRYPNAGPQVVTAADGGMTVYAVLGTRLARWTGRAPGVLGAPEDLGGGPLAPAISVITDAEGRQLVFALRFSRMDGSTSGNVREVVMLRQRTPGGAFESSWTGLGTPETRPRRSRLTGTPTAVTGSDGRIHVFVRNGDKGVSTRVMDQGGTWSPWRALPGGYIQEGLSATVDGGGLIHLFAASPGWVEHWAQRTRSGELRKASRRLVAKPGDAPDAVTAADGSVLVGYRPVTSDRVMVERLAAGRTGRWTTVANPAVPGYGRVSLVGGRKPGADGLLMAVAADGGEGLVYDVRDGGVAHARAQESAVTVGTPAALTSTDGGPASVVTLGLTGRPTVTRLLDGAESQAS
ncbi:PIG-L family deacetylase [Streptomyces sp. P9(2023)]|uniref:PIG-L family deacetylase n=1 Tax=Streptomyces sp. P9(2023) TaxID=3064394 RepID=UPI0028F41743|nr:PIG-L family deacetylase [Streptomyces sp. P9(2023)]MDT9693725.1 PIG-L family deacetylase [Streptomyces sp. P9(2023)]